MGLTREMFGRKNFKIAVLAILFTLIIGGFVIWYLDAQNPDGLYTGQVSNFEECVAAGNPVMESYPRQCRHGEKTFVENIEPIISKEEALAIAQNEKECSKTGILTDQISYNSHSKTWKKTAAIPPA